jgi:glycosyltransferase 2 family protein
MKAKLKSLLSLVLRFGLSFVLLGYLFGKIDFNQTISVVKSADVGYLVLAGVIFLALHLIILLRWFVFILALRLAVPFGVMTRYFFIGLFGNLFLPTAIGGDVIKILGLCHYSGKCSPGVGAQKPKVVASVLLDRLSGFAGIVIVGILAFAFGFHLINDVTLLVSIVLLALLSVAVGVVLFNETVYSFCCRVFNRLPQFKQSLMNLHYDIALLKGRQYALYQSVILSALAQGVLAVIFFLIAKALHQDVALIYFLIFVPLICVASTVPSIGGLGVREAGAAYLLGKVGVEAGIAVSISLINFIFMVAVGLVGGLVYMVTKDVHVPMAEVEAEADSVLK